jgi:hypothetical protein
VTWIHISEDAGRLRPLMAEDSEGICWGVEINAGMGVARASVIRYETCACFATIRGLGTWSLDAVWLEMAIF